MKMLWLSLTLVLGVRNAQAGLDPRFEPLVLETFSQALHLHDENLPRLQDLRTEHDKAGRDNVWITLADENGESFRIRVVGPKNFRSDKKARPFVFVSAGFFSGTEPVELMKDTNDVLVAAFEYTADTDATLRDPEKIARLMASIPARLFFAIKWLQTQSWVKHDQFHVLGVSLGSLFLPVSLRLLQTNNVPFASYIDAFSGAEVRQPFINILATHVGLSGIDGVADAIATVTQPYDPAFYLPALRGPKLVIHGAQDEVFTPAISARLDRLLSGPKLTCVVQGRHIDMDRPRELQLTAGLLKAWVGALVKGSFPQIQQEDTVCKTEF